MDTTNDSTSRPAAPDIYKVWWRRWVSDLRDREPADVARILNRQKDRLAALGDLFTTFGSGAGTDDKGEPYFLYPGFTEPWERALADYIDHEITESAALVAVVIGLQINQPPPTAFELDVIVPAVRALARDVWDLAYLEPTYADVGTGWQDDEDAEPAPFKDRLPHYWAVPEHVRGIIARLRHAATAALYDEFAAEYATDPDRQRWATDYAARAARLRARLSAAA